MKFSRSVKVYGLIMFHAVIFARIWHRLAPVSAEEGSGMAVAAVFGGSIYSMIVDYRRDKRARVRFRQFRRKLFTRRRPNPQIDIT